MKDIKETLRILTSSRKEQRPLNIVVTGCNRYVRSADASVSLGDLQFVRISLTQYSFVSCSGIGLQACKLLRLLSPYNKLFLAARTREKAEVAAREIASESLNENGVSTATTLSDDPITNVKAMENTFPMACDHSSLESVRQFCQELTATLKMIGERDGETVGIDVLCLNAAILLGEGSEAEFTKDELELTMQTNHFAPFLIGNMLFDLINPTGRVVVTSSGLHAFASFNNFKGVIIDEVTGNIRRKNVSMMDGEKYDHKNCYAISKLCNAVFCAALNRRLRQRNAISVCFTPGLIPTSGLFRRQKLWHEKFLTKEATNMVETEEWGGVFLAWMTVSDDVGKDGGRYWRAPFGVSCRGGKIPDDIYASPMNKEAEDENIQETLWRISAALTGLLESETIIVG